MSAPFCDGVYDTVLGRLAVAVGRVDDGIEHLEAAIADLERLGGRPAMVRAQHDLACALRTRGRPDDRERTDGSARRGRGDRPDAVPSCPRGGGGSRTGAAPAVHGPAARAMAPRADFRARAGGRVVEPHLQRPGCPAEGQPIDTHARPVDRKPGSRLPRAGSDLGRRRGRARRTPGTRASSSMSEPATATASGWRSCARRWPKLKSWRPPARQPRPRGDRGARRRAVPGDGAGRSPASGRRRGGASPCCGAAQGPRRHPPHRRDDARGRPAPGLGREDGQLLLLPAGGQGS